jgi:hypothetical protein
MSQPILELDNSVIEGGRDVRRSGLCNATFDQETNEPAHAAHVLGREDLMLTVATTLASMSCEPRDDAVIDVANHDGGAAQPLSKVTGGVPVTCHGQSRVPKSPQVPGERLHKRPQHA